MQGVVPSNCIMRMRTAVTTIECSIVMIVGASVPGFAQSDSVSTANATTIAALRARSATPVDGHARPEAARVAPSNLIFPDSFREVIESMLARSSAFRRQCQRLANAPDVVVRLQSLNPYAPGTARARTNIVRGPGVSLVATMEIRPLDDFPELIAHELEHVIEQLDGIDLRQQSTLPGTGVRSCSDGSFETVRAVRVGERVSQETRMRR
jgi:hypothetical protein